MSHYFGSRTCVTIYFELFDIFCYLWPIISLADEFVGFCRSAMSHLWEFMVFGDKSGSYPFFIWYPNLYLVL